MTSKDHLYAFQHLREAIEALLIGKSGETQSRRLERAIKCLTFLTEDDFLPEYKDKFKELKT